MWYLVLGILGGYTLLHAQGGSNYSVFGAGDLRPSVGALYDGVASIAVALPSAYGISTVNPALWTFARSTRLQGGYRFNQHSITGAAGTRAQNNGTVEGLLLLFAIDTTRGWSASFGFYPFSSTNAFAGIPLTVPLPDDTLQGSYRVLSTGGISLLHLGVATQPLPSLGVGVALRYHFGLFRTERATVLADQWSAPDTLTVTDWLSGFGANLGVWYRPSPGWLLAAAVSSPVTVSSQQVWRYSFAHTFGDSLLERRFRWQIPAFVAAGISHSRGRLSAVAEVLYSDFRAFTYRQPEGVSFQPLIRLSAGVHRALQPGGGRSYWQQLGLSAGLSWQRLYYRVHQRSITEYAVATGLSLPLGRTAVLDIASQVGIRGERSAGLLRELFGRLTFTVSLGEQWFIPRRQRYSAP